MARQTNKPQNGPVKVIHPEESLKPAQQNAAVRMAATALLAAMADPLAAQAALGPATLRERAKGATRGVTGRSSGPGWQWPEDLRESARSLDPKFALNYGRSTANGNLPYGKPNVKDMEKLANGIVEPIPTETKQILSSQIVVDFINGFYNGIKLSQCMADGDSVPLVWFIEIMGFNLDTYRKIEAWQSLRKLLARIAQASGRYCLISRDGNLSLSVTRPESGNSEDSESGNSAAD